MPIPQILTDELRFQGLASDIAQGRIYSGWSAFREYPSNVYPLLLSPFYFFPVSTAYSCSKIFNAFLATSAVFPIWVLARKALPRSWSLTVSIVSLSLPVFGYASTLMAENLFTPLFLTVLALFVARPRMPSWGHVSITGALFGALILTKTQGIFLLPVLVVGPLVSGDGGRRCSAMRWAAAGMAVGLIGGALVVLDAFCRFGFELWLKAFQPSTWLGYYATYLHRPPPWRPAAEATNWVYNFTAFTGEFGLGVGLVAYASALNLGLTGRRAGARLVAISALACWVMMTKPGVELAVYFDDPHFVYERYSASLAPLFLIAGAGSLRQRPVLFQRMLVACTGVGALLARWVVKQTSQDHLINDTPGLGWVRALPSQHLGLEIAALVVVVGLIYTLTSSRPWLFAVAVVTVLGLTSATWALIQHRYSSWKKYAAFTLAPFAQHLHGSGAQVHFLVDGLPLNEVWQAEFFVGDGENHALSLEFSSYAKHVSVGLDGELLTPDPMEAGSYLVASRSINLGRMPSEAVDEFAAYKIDSKPLRLNGGSNPEHR